MARAALVLVGVLCSLVLTGCGEDAQEKAFHQQLIDKARNDATRQAGEAFLAGNASAPGVVSLPSGLQYKVLEVGSGASPKSGDRVRVEYEGRLIDGTLFDSSHARGKPIVAPLDRVIQGWREGLQRMKEGSEWVLYIPTDLAYGTISPSPSVPPNSALIFKLKLLEVLPAQ